MGACVIVSSTWASHPVIVITWLPRFLADSYTSTSQLRLLHHNADWNVGAYSENDWLYIRLAFIYWKTESSAFLTNQVNRQMCVIYDVPRVGFVRKAGQDMLWSTESYLWNFWIFVSGYFIHFWKPKIFQLDRWIPISAVPRHYPLLLDTLFSCSPLIKWSTDAPYRIFPTSLLLVWQWESF